MTSMIYDSAATGNAGSQMIPLTMSTKYLMYIYNLAIKYPMVPNWSELAVTATGP